MLPVVRAIVAARVGAADEQYEPNSSTRRDAGADIRACRDTGADGRALARADHGSHRRTGADRGALSVAR